MKEETKIQKNLKGIERKKIINNHKLNNKKNKFKYKIDKKGNLNSNNYIINKIIYFSKTLLHYFTLI